MSHGVCYSLVLPWISHTITHSRQTLLNSDEHHNISAGTPLKKKTRSICNICFIIIINLSHTFPSLWLTHTHTERDSSIFCHLCELVGVCVFVSVWFFQVDSRLPVAPALLQSPHAGLISPAHSSLCVPSKPRIWGRTLFLSMSIQFQQQAPNVLSIWFFSRQIQFTIKSQLTPQHKVSHLGFWQVSNF